MGKARRETRPRGPATAGSEQAERRRELAARTAGIVLLEGLGDLGLRKLAARLGTSDRMLLYYFRTKDQLVVEAMEEVSARLAAILTRRGGGPPVSAGRFLANVLELARDPEVGPFLRLWTEVIALAARGERPYDRIASSAVGAWLAWIDSRLTPPPGGAEPARPAALLAIVEGVSLLEMAAPGCTADVQSFLSRALDAGGA
jgi:AcrR family transcriptional regulator